MKRNKLDSLEKKLNIANDLVQELSSVVEDFTGETLPAIVDSTVEVPEVIEDPKVFQLDNLKTDFMLVRNNIIKLIGTGQRILDSASLIDPSDLNPKQLEALSGLQNAIGSNLKLLIDSYKQIAEIEKLRTKETKKPEAIANSNVNMGSVTNNQIVFSGSTDQLLDFLKQNNS